MRSFRDPAGALDRTSSAHCRIDRPVLADKPSRILARMSPGVGMGRRVSARRGISGRHSPVSRVAVVGAGVMGCAAAWALTARGADVTVYEQYELDHDRGSSHGRSRIVRLSYPEAHWVRLAVEA